MFEINVDVKVKLHTGAEITLTDEQSRRIKNYALEVVLGKEDSVLLPTATRQPYRKTKRRGVSKTLHAWKEGEDQPLRDLVEKFAHIKHGERSPERMQALRDIKQVNYPHRTWAAVCSRFNDVLQEKRNEVSRLETKVEPRRFWNQPVYIKK
jgi:hypothetical protein